MFFTHLPDQNDSLLITYILNQVQINLLEPSKPLYWATFFAPYADTLAYSDLFLTSALWSLPLKLITSNPLVIYNIVLVFGGFLLTFFTTYLLLNFLSHHHYSSILISLIFTFSPLHLHYLPHLQIFSFWLVPLAIYFLLKFIKYQRSIFFHLYLITLTAQIADSFFTAYLIFFSSLIIFIFHSQVGQRRLLIKYFPLVLLYFLIWLLLARPYIKLHYNFPEATRPIRDAAHFSLGIEELFTRYRPWLLSGLFIFSLFIKKITTSTKPFFYLLFFSLLLSLGPVLKYQHQTIKIANFPIPLPYSLFYYLFPGFNGFRTPSRWILLTALAATIIISLRLTPFIQKLQPSTKILLYLFISLYILLNIFSLKFYPVNLTPPPVYTQVKNLPINSAILELPIKLWNMEDHQIESQRSLYSLYHQKRRFNGYSGFSPLEWINTVQNIVANKQQLNQELILKLKSLGITHVVQKDQVIPLTRESL